MRITVFAQVNSIISAVRKDSSSRKEGDSQLKLQPLLPTIE